MFFVKHNLSTLSERRKKTWILWDVFVCPYPKYLVGVAADKRWRTVDDVSSHPHLLINAAPASVCEAHYKPASDKHVLIPNLIYHLVISITQSTYFVFQVVLAHATHLYFDHPQEPDPEDRGYYWATRFIDTQKTFGYRYVHMDRFTL